MQIINGELRIFDETPLFYKLCKAIKPTTLVNDYLGNLIKILMKQQEKYFKYSTINGSFKISSGVYLLR